MNQFTKTVVQMFFILVSHDTMIVIPSSLAQISLGYRNPVVASGSMGRSFLKSTFQTNRFSILGENVIPNDSSNNFNRLTIWIIKDQDQAFSLKTEDENPLIQSTSVFEETHSTSVSRTETLPIVVSGPASNALRSVFPQVSGLNESELVTPEALGF